MEFLLGVLLVQSWLVCLAFSFSNFTDQHALLAFKTEIKIDPNNILGSNWNTTTNFCNWVGVSCSRRRQRVRALELGHMGLQGTISPYVGNLSFLVRLNLRNNSFHGPLTHQIGRLGRLKELILADNKMEGIIPPTLFHCRMLQNISLRNNRFSGQIPEELGTLSKVQILYLNRNNFTGTIPSSLANLSTLQIIRDIGFFTESNRWYPTKFNWKFFEFASNFFAPECQIRGSIPREIGSLKNLNLLELSKNNVSGSIPSSVGALKSLQRLYLDGNKLEGLIPQELCQLSQVGELSLQSNVLFGPIPACIGNLRHLQQLDLSSNNLSSSIPMSLWTLENLLFLNLSSNSLGGDLPLQMRMSNVMNNMDLSRNHIEGSIPPTIGSFKILTAINLSRNSFQGSIPKSFGVVVGLEFIDLSYNNISGTIPKSLEALRSLKYLNLSYNKLSGEILNRGPFVNFTAESFMGNEALCGQSILQIPTCKIHNSEMMQIKQIFLKYILPIIASIVLVVSFTYIVIKYRGSKTQTPNLVDLAPIIEHKRISYQELRDATNNFCDANLLGVGSFGSVFKGVLADGIIVAVKILNLELDGAFKSFDAECKVLRNIRHRNLVKVISSCSNLELRALVLQYMSNGSLEKWLYSHNYCLDLFQRVSIMFDVALALEYLHHGQSEVVVHCDLKPNNILLDEDMVAHVADFGIAKIMAQNKTETQTKTLGTIGYIAPEYGSEGRVSTKGDIYSYGIMLLEIFTRKKPTDEMFTGELSLRQWVSASLPSKLMEVVEGGLFTTRGGTTTTQGIILAIMELGMECCKESPEERCDIKEVVVKLNKTKMQLLQNRGD
ncbi:hypothetical protein F0562_030567 [Nyssa sinensis]|uniref:non-specific serine/threonine protein kinase n=1 Tax=Nyssa sinensis TaxID=561372 RepID=A0A5J5B190_9ASTE|nr:hypothetical protein F0562_030567 [Nyssa sinensis]